MPSISGHCKTNRHVFSNPIFLPKYLEVEYLRPGAKVTWAGLHYFSSCLSCTPCHHFNSSIFCRIIKNCPQHELWNSFTVITRATTEAAHQWIQLLEGPATSCMWSSHLHILWTQLAYTYSAHLSRPGFRSVPKHSENSRFPHLVPNPPSYLLEAW